MKEILLLVLYLAVGFMLYSTQANVLIWITSGVALFFVSKFIRGTKVS